MNLFIYLVKLIYMIKFLVALAFGILDFCVLDFKSSKRWSLQSNGQEQYLMKGHQSFKVGLKRSSLCAVGSINMI